MGTSEPGRPVLESLDLEEVGNAPTIAEPLSKYDCCLVSDGGGALIVTSTARAKNLKKPPVVVLGAARRTGIGDCPDARSDRDRCYR